MKLFLLIIIFSIFENVNAQSGDFMLLKKHNKTLQSYYVGTNIDLITNSGIAITGMIYKMANDSIYIKQFIVQKAFTTFGTYILDTVGSYRYQYHFNQIKMIGSKPNKGFSLAASGATLMGTGSLLTILSGYFYFTEPVIKRTIKPTIISASLALIGFALLKLDKHRSSGMKIGKKYTLIYMSSK